MNQAPPGHIESFTEFLEAAIHNILFLREVYPPQLFERAKLFSVPLHQCRSPDVAEYIKEVVAGAIHWLKLGRLERLAVQLNYGNAPPHERIVIEVATNWTALIAGSSILELESLLRTFLIKINVLDSHLGSERATKPPTTGKGAPPQELNWQVFAYVTEDTDPIPNKSTADEIQKFPWLDPDRNEVALGGLSNSTTSLVPIRSAALGEHLKLQIFAECIDTATDLMENDIEEC